MPLKVLHFADVHLRDKDIEEIQKCLDFIVADAEKEAPDLIVMAGDLFDSRAVRLDSVSAKAAFDVMTALADIAPVAVLIGTPSHDGLAAEVLEHIGSMYNVAVVSTPKQLHLYNSMRLADPSELTPGATPRAILSFMPTPTKQFFHSDSGITETNQEIGQAMGAIFAGFGAHSQELGSPPHILVGHFQVGGAFVSETQQLTGVDIEVSRQQIELAGADVVCLGHIHMHQEIGSNIFYSGSIYRKDFGELDNKGFYYHLIDTDRYELLDSCFVETPTRRLVKHTLDWTTGVEKKSDSVFGAIVRVEIKVWQDEAAKIDRDEIRSNYINISGAADADIRIIRVPRETVRSEHILKLKTLREKMTEMASIRGEDDLSESVLAKCDALEGTASDDLLKTVGMAN